MQADAATKYQSMFHCIKINIEVYAHQDKVNKLEKEIEFHLTLASRLDVSVPRQLDDYISSCASQLCYVSRL